MKNLPKTALLVYFLLLVLPLAAQIKKPGITLGASAFYANPKGEFNDAYKGGMGGEIKGGIGLGKTYLVATVGYAAFASRSNARDYGTLTYKPVKIGIKQYLLMKRLFINGDVGVATLKDKTLNKAENRFSADIGAGVRLLGMELSVYYDTWKNLHGNGSANTVQYKLGYNLTL